MNRWVHKTLDLHHNVLKAVQRIKMFVLLQQPKTILFSLLSQISPQIKHLLVPKAGKNIK